MKYIKDIVVLVLAIGLMGILGLIVYDEFKMANEQTNIKSLELSLEHHPGGKGKGF